VQYILKSRELIGFVELKALLVLNWASKFKALMSGANVGTDEETSSAMNFIIFAKTVFFASALKILIKSAGDFD
jgi:hypothetical protein